MSKHCRLAGLSLLFAASCAAAADPAFYVVSVVHNGNALLFGGSKTPPATDLPYVIVDGAKMDCCFRAGPRPGARKAARRDDDGRVAMMSEQDKPVFTHAGHIRPPGKRQPDVGYGVEGMKAVTAKPRDTYEITLQSGDPVYVRTCYTAEGLRFRLFRRMADRQPYASYYFYLGYDYELEPTCR
jgi:hypothetical protein